MPALPDPRILLIRPSALGDVARTVPCLVALRSALPDARIDWLVNPAYAAAVREHPALDAIVPFPREALSGTSLLWKAPAFIRMVRARRYDRVYDLQGLLRSGLTARATGAPRRVGDANAREGAPFFYTLKYRIDPEQHTVERMLALLDADGVSIPETPAEVDLKLYVADADAAWAEATLSPEAPDTNPGLRQTFPHLLALAPTAQWLCKCWPITRYVALTRRLLAENPAARVVVLAAPTERSQVQAAFTPLTPPELERITMPETTVGQMMALISRASLLVCNDSAPLHLAVGLGTPTVSLFGPTDPLRVGPYPINSPLHRVLQPPRVEAADLTRYRKHKNDQTLISQIPMEAVVEATEGQRDAGTK